MVDLFTRRRVIFALATVFVVTIVLLFFAQLRVNLIHHVLEKEMDLKATLNNISISDCYESEPFDIITSCSQCNAYERQYQKATCEKTDYKEGVMCTKSNIRTVRSCPVPIAVKHQKFWIFEGFMLFIAFVSIFNVSARQKYLDKQMVDKIRRQIGDDEQ